MLPDEVLLEVFDLCRGDNKYFSLKLWKPLVHVCQRWRQIVFKSPRRLHLVLDCDAKTSVRLLAIWPSLPITMRYAANEEEDEENVIAALEHRRRILQIVFKNLTGHVLEKFTAVMQEPLFPALTYLRLQPIEETRLVIPNEFLGGSAPQLRIFFVDGIAFPTLPRLVASATHLTNLRLEKIPDAGYISPEAMVSCLSMLLELEDLVIGFQSRQPSRSQVTQPSSAWLPSLTRFEFKGDAEYLKNLIAEIRAPNLDILRIRIFADVTFVNPDLHNFINVAEKLRQLKRARISLEPWSVGIALGRPTSLDLGTRCDRLDQRISWMVQLCGALLHLLCHVEDLEISGDADSPSELQGAMESAESRWLELFRTFTAVRRLYVTKKLGPLVAHTCQELNGERASEVLPALHHLFLGGLGQFGYVEDVIEPFNNARRQSNLPGVVVENWEQDPYQELEYD